MENEKVNDLLYSNEVVGSLSGVCALLAKTIKEFHFSNDEKKVFMFLFSVLSIIASQFNLSFEILIEVISSCCIHFREIVKAVRKKVNKKEANLYLVYSSTLCSYIGLSFSQVLKKDQVNYIINMLTAVLLRALVTDYNFFKSFSHIFSKGKKEKLSGGAFYDIGLRDTFVMKPSNFMDTNVSYITDFLRGNIPSDSQPFGNTTFLRDSEMAKVMAELGVPPTKADVSSFLRVHEPWMKGQDLIPSFPLYKHDTTSKWSSNLEDYPVISSSFVPLSLEQIKDQGEKFYSDVSFPTTAFATDTLKEVLEFAQKEGKFPSYDDVVKFASKHNLNCPSFRGYIRTLNFFYKQRYFDSVQKIFGTNRPVTEKIVNYFMREIMRYNGEKQVLYSMTDTNSLVSATGALFETSWDEFKQKHPTAASALDVTLSLLNTAIFNGINGRGLTLGKILMNVPDAVLSRYTCDIRIALNSVKALETVARSGKPFSDMVFGKGGELLKGGFPPAFTLYPAVHQALRLNPLIGSNAFSHMSGDGSIALPPNLLEMILGPDVVAKIPFNQLYGYQLLNYESWHESVLFSNELRRLSEMEINIALSFDSLPKHLQTDELSRLNTELRAVAGIAPDIVGFPLTCEQALVIHGNYTLPDAEQQCKFAMESSPTWQFLIKNNFNRSPNEDEVQKLSDVIFSKGNIGQSKPMTEGIPLQVANAFSQTILTEEDETNTMAKFLEQFFEENPSPVAPSSIEKAFQVAFDIAADEVQSILARAVRRLPAGSVARERILEAYPNLLKDQSEREMKAAFGDNAVGSTASWFHSWYISLPYFWQTLIDGILYLGKIALTTYLFHKGSAILGRIGLIAERDHIQENARRAANGEAPLPPRERSFLEQYGSSLLDAGVNALDSVFTQLRQSNVATGREYGKLLQTGTQLLSHVPGKIGLIARGANTVINALSSPVKSQPSSGQKGFTLQPMTNMFKSAMQKTQEERKSYLSELKKFHTENEKKKKEEADEEAENVHPLVPLQNVNPYQAAPQQPTLKQVKAALGKKTGKKDAKKDGKKRSKPSGKDLSSAFTKPVKIKRLQRISLKPTIRRKQKDKKKKKRYVVLKRQANKRNTFLRKK